MLSVLAPTVAFLRAGVPTVYGREGVRELLSSAAPASQSRITWEPLGGGVAYDLMAAFTYGITARQAQANAAIVFERYIAVWQRTRGNPWEIVRSEITFDVKFGGRTEPYADEQGRYRVRWVPEKVVKGVAYDTPVPGYRAPTTNLLRLWKAEATESFDFQAFNIGDYYRAVDEKVISETISKVLYPNDEPDAGKQLRLAQQYFFVSCSLQDMIRLLMLRGKPLEELCISGKQHSEGRRGFGHDRLPVATGSPQALRIPNRE